MTRVWVAGVGRMTRRYISHYDADPSMFSQRMRDARGQTGRGWYATFAGRGYVERLGNDYGRFDTADDAFESLIAAYPNDTWWLH